jgi:uncharacterized phiE125 gp8 family phage protein
MRRYIVNPPLVEPLELTEMKRWLRVDHGDDDQLILGLVRAARERVEARTGRTLLAQTWRIVLDQWPGDGRVALPVMPVMSVIAVRVSNSGGLFNVISPTAYTLDARFEPATLTLNQITQPGVVRGGIEVDVVTGYGVNPADCPGSLRQAMLLMIGEAYARRGPDQSIVQRAPVVAEIERLLTPYCSIRLGRTALSSDAARASL